jgi:uncharacterized protein (TIGR03437 family)
MAEGGHVGRLVVLLICSLVLFAAGATAQVPSVWQGGVVNGASFRPANAPGGGVAAGSIVSIFGSHLANSTVEGASLPLPTTLGGVSVRIGGLAAPLFFVSAGQINAQVPWGVATGTSTVTVTNGGASSTPVNVTIQDSSPGLFSQARDGRGPGAVLNYVPERQAYVTNTPGATVNPSGIVTIYGTGFGRVTNPPADGTAAGAGTQTTVATPVVMIGGRQATIRSSGLAPNYVGLYQINAVIPTGTPEGCYLPVTVAFGSNVSNAVTIGVTNNRVDCNVATSGSTGLSIGGSYGYATFSKITTQTPFISSGLLPQPADRIDAFFRRYQTRTPTSLALYPPVGGGCNVWLFRADSLPTDTSMTTDIGLNAGTLTLSRTGFISQALGLKQVGEYGYELGQNVIQASGVWTLTGSGGPDVGQFSVTQTLPSLLFTMRDFGVPGGSGMFSQSSPLNLSWSCPDAGDPVGVSVASFDATTKLMGMAFCSFSCGNGTGQVGADVLKQLPLSGQSGATIVSVYTPNAAKIPPIKASGLTQGAFGLVITSTMSGLQLVQ